MRSCLLALLAALSSVVVAGPTKQNILKKQIYINIYNA